MKDVLNIINAGSFKLKKTAQNTTYKPISKEEELEHAIKMRAQGKGVSAIKSAVDERKEPSELKINRLISEIVALEKKVESLSKTSGDEFKKEQEKLKAEKAEKDVQLEKSLKEAITKYTSALKLFSGVLEKLKGKILGEGEDLGREVTDEDLANKDPKIKTLYKDILSNTQKARADKSDVEKVLKGLLSAKVQLKEISLEDQKSKLAKELDAKRKELKAAVPSHIGISKDAFINEKLEKARNIKARNTFSRNSATNKDALTKKIEGANEAWASANELQDRFMEIFAKPSKSEAKAKIAITGGAESPLAQKFDKDSGSKSEAIEMVASMKKVVDKVKGAGELRKEENQHLLSENAALKHEIARITADKEELAKRHEGAMAESIANSERVKRSENLVSEVTKENSSLKEVNGILYKNIHELTAENKKLSSALSNSEIKSEASARLYTGLIGKNKALSGEKPNFITTFIDGTQNLASTFISGTQNFALTFAKGTQNIALTCVNGAQNLTPYAVGVTGLLLATDFALGCVAPQYAFLSSTAVLGYKLVDVASGVVARYGIYQVGKYIGEKEVKGQGNIFLGLPATVICPIFSNVTFSHEKAIEGLLVDAALIAAGYCKGIFEKDKYADFFCVMKKGLACGASSVLGAFSSSFGYDVWSNAERTSIIGLVCTGIASTACYMESSYSSRNQQVSIQR